ncbi:MAG: glutathione peroxidase [Alphaproteobacteria bacterium]|nr:glutathione peroxidase [Alphaproteobacteria bacterium]
MNSLYDINVYDAEENLVSLKSYRNKIVMIVNVASKCGLTPQYDKLQKLYEQYRGQGFIILGFPSNDFAGQEPGTNKEIQEFCRLNYGVTFPVFAKIHVKGSDCHPLYTWLVQNSPQKKSEYIQWNFEKFLIDHKGHVKVRYAPDTDPEDPKIIQDIKNELKNIS